MNTMPDAYAAKESLLEALLCPALLTVEVGGVLTPETLPADVFFHPMQGIEGLEMAHLLAPLGHSAMLVRGTTGAHSERVSVQPAVRLHVLSGAMLWWQESQGNERRRVEAGEALLLAPFERHGFVVLEDCLNYNLFTPALTSSL